MINTETELIEKIEEIKNNTPFDSLLLFRGENQKYDKMCSGKARPNLSYIPEIEQGWNTIVERIINDNKASTEYKQSILQHYGYPTYFLDLTCDPLVAAWFATMKCENEKPIRWIGSIGSRIHNIKYHKLLNSGIGYLYILQIPNYRELINSNILYKLTSEKLFKRPQNQSAYLMLDKPKSQIDPNDYIIHTIKINRKLFRPSYKHSKLFPPPTIDEGYNKLLDVPFIKKPFDPKIGFCELKKDSISIENDYFLNNSIRIIDIPLYVKNINYHQYINPKRKDLTLYEPVIFRNWKTFLNNNLSEFYDNNNIKLNTAKKISITPQVLRSINSEDTLKNKLKWPSINSDTILFTLCDEVHDIAEQQGPPYWGFWLYHYGNFIIELNIIIEDERNLKYNINPGYIYKFENTLELYNPDRIEITDDITMRINIIKSLLSISEYCSLGKVTMLPNPFEIEDWFIVF